MHVPHCQVFFSLIRFATTTSSLYSLLRATVAVDTRYCSSPSSMERSISTLLGSLLTYTLLIFKSLRNDTQVTAAGFQDNAPKTPHPVFRLGPRITDWDEQRTKWLQKNPGMSLNRDGKLRIILVTSSQTDPCPSANGDHYLLKAMKNKLDYIRIHDIELYYNMVAIDPAMTDFFIKLPIVRKLMLTHPEAEWIWWMDSDAFFTDMAFEIPLEKYRDHNLVMWGLDEEVYELKNWVGLNTGSFLMRNCQWSLDTLDTWAALGEDYDDNLKRMGKHTSEVLTQRPDFILDDQTALVYLLVTSKSNELKSKLFLENSFALHGYWITAMQKHDELMKEPAPRTAAGEEYWPFVTHFVGCKPCRGRYGSYDLDLCYAEMERAFNIADNQVLHILGFEHEDLSSPKVKRTRRDLQHASDFFPVDALDFLRKYPWGRLITRHNQSLPPGWQR